MAENDPTETTSEEKVPMDDVKARLAGKEPEKKEPELTPEPKQEKAPPKQEEPDPDLERIVAEADKPDAVRNALTAEREKAKTARERAEAAEARVKEYEDRDKSEEQKREEKAEANRARADAAETKLQRVEVAIAAKLPLELAERLRGDTKEELEQDAARLLDLVKPNTPTGDPDAGKGAAPQKQADMNDILRKKAGVN